jgi:protein ImuB
MLDTPTRVVVVQFPHWSSFAFALGRSARSAFEPIVRAVVAHAPLVEVTAPGVIVFATRGPSRYVGGDEPLAALVHSAVGDAVRATAGDTAGATIGSAFDAQRSHAAFGVGIADGRLAAGIASQHALRASEPVVVPANESSRWLATAPVRSLVDCVEVIGAVGAGVPGADDIASYRDVVSLLERLGLYRFGDVAALDESHLVARFGAFGRDLSRLSRGLDRHPPLVGEPPPDRVCLLQFDGPVESRDTVVNAVEELASQLVDHLGAQGVAMVRLHVVIESDHGERSERMWYRSEGFSARAVIESLRWQLDAWILHDAPTSGVVMVRLSPEQLIVNAGRQSALWGGERDGDRHAQRAVRRVADMNGADSVTVPAWRGDRDPARMFQFVRSDAVDLERRTAGDAVDLATGEWRGVLPSPAPSLVFDSTDDAPKVRVLDSLGRAVAIDARHAMSADPACVCIDDDTYDVVAWAGPWPVEERWWDARRARRAVRLQLLVRQRHGERSDASMTDAVTSRAMVAVLERQTWRLAAIYA